MKKISHSRLVIALIATLIGGCAFVSLDSAARNVTVIPAGKTTLVAECKFLSNTTVTLWNKADTFQSDDTVEGQLNILARNEAAKIGGDAVVAASAVNGNQRTFKVYDCGTSKNK